MPPFVVEYSPVAGAFEVSLSLGGRLDTDLEKTSELAGRRGAATLDDIRDDRIDRTGELRAKRGDVTAAELTRVLVTAHRYQRNAYGWGSLSSP